MDQQTKRPTGDSLKVPSRTGKERAPLASGMSVRKRKKARLLARLRGVMLIVCGMILFTGLLLAFLPMLRVKSIEVKGNVYYSTEEIIEMSNIKVGDEMLALDLEDSWTRLVSGMEYLDYAVVRVKSPVSIVIEITEKPSVAYTAYNGKYYSFDESFCVLAESDAKEAFSGFVFVELPEITALSVGESIRFADEDVGYVQTLLDTVCGEGLAPHTTLLDCRGRYDSAIVLGGVCRIEVGSVRDLAAKLQLAQGIVVSKGVSEGQYVVVDVSDPAAATYRILSSAELLLNQ